MQVKRIVINPSAQLSLLIPHHRAEHGIFISGATRVTCGEKDFLLWENPSLYIPFGVIHRLKNPGTIPLELIEVQSGSYLGEGNIVRFEDKYARV
ncbi:cupin domain-containing protein [Microbulbifer sp. SAOS-129_SWC]|uniref:cupin domain-containing protein n=1 Tax=Microbulbifer sp. SAOS-129_SWC TaxID=3145235 RepID=UPI003216F2D8